MIWNQRRIRATIKRLISGPRRTKLRSTPRASLRARISAGSETNTTSTIPGRRMRRAMTSARCSGPRKEAIAHVPQNGMQRWGMSQQHLAHVIFLYPINAEGRVDLGVVIAGQEAVTFDPAPSHDNEDAECRVRDSESRRPSFRQRAGQKINAFDILVNFFQFLLPSLILRELLERFRDTHAQHAAERAIAWNTALAVADNICRSQIGHDALIDFFR